MNDLCGQTIRGYELRELLGIGESFAVYRAYQPSVGREVAIKIIHPRYANHPDFIRRFETEAQLVARLDHLRIVPLYDYWREPDGAYLVMRFLRGGDLREALACGPWSVDRAIKLLDQIAEALTAAHRQGVIHRDIKPENILLDEEGNAYLTDFSIAIDMARATVAAQEGARAGSPAYISPEQAQDRPVSPQTDIYSLGVVLYEVLAGEHPFPNLPPTAQLLKHRTEPLPPLHDRRPDLPMAVNDVIQRATAKDPAERFPDAQSLAAAFRQATQKIKGYELIGQIGSGAFGDIYRARQPQVDREVAIKVIRPEYANQPDFIRRFEAEARLVAQLEHLHIVPLYDYWREPDGAYLVMRLMKGGSLEKVLD